jgi:hypothetical protein
MVSGFTKKDGSTYVCACCGKRTRETGLGESNCELCAYCYEESGLENSFSDGSISKEIFDEAISNLKKQYNR